MRKTLAIAIIIAIIAILGIRVVTGKHRISEASITKASILGISVQDSPDGGVLITAVHANSLAEQKGLQPNDVILAVNGKPVENQGGYQQALDRALMEKNATFRIKRASGEVKVRLDLESAAVYNNLGNAYMKDKEYGQAMNAYEKSLKLDPNFAEAYYNLGSVYAQQKEYDLAVKNYKKAIELRADFQAAYYKLADVYDKQGKSKDAIKTYKEIVQTRPSNTIASDLRPVEIIHAAKGEIKVQLKFSGTIEPRARIDIFPKAAGVVERMNVDEGSIVRKNQILAVVEHEELELQVRQAEAAITAAQSGYDQAVQLSETRIRSQVAQARAGREAAEAALEQVRDLAETRTETQIQQAEAALDALKANLEKIRRGAREEEREQVRATVAQANANLSNAQSNYDRMKKLFDAGAISKQTYEGTQTQLQVAEAQSRTAQEQWNMVEEGARREDIQAMEAQVKQAEAVFKLAKKQVDKLTWQKDIAMAEAQAKQARAALESTEILVKAKSWEAEITVAQTQLIQATVAADLARKQLADASVEAPIQGIISRCDLDEGGMANPMAPIFELVDMDEVHADVDVLEADLGKIHLGDEAWVHVASLSKPVKSRVTSISPTVDEITRTVKVEVTVDNSDHLLKPGMFAQVFIPTDVRPTAVLLPRSAVIEDEATNSRYVFVADSGKSRKITVEYGLTEGSLVEIASGLEAGASVVVAGQQNLTDGDHIQIVRVIKNL